MKIRYFLLIATFVFQYGIAQDANAWFYIRANDTVFEPVFKGEQNQLIYVGDDSTLKEVLDRHKMILEIHKDSLTIL